MTNSAVKEHPSVESLVGNVADEFLRRQRQGERPDIEDYAARYPDAAPVLRNVLASLELIEFSGASVREPVESPATDEPAGTLGDFQLLRQVGHGGMGIVYEAIQISLNRRVAVKVLPFAATLDPKRLQRFKNEAQAAAQLHHTNIVPVYFVGCERGVHFYAMQFIDGQTLAAVIRDQGLGNREQGSGNRDRAEKPEAADSPATVDYAPFARPAGPMARGTGGSPPGTVVG